MPWVLAKEEDKTRLETVIYNLLACIKHGAVANSFIFSSEIFNCSKILSDVDGKNGFNATAPCLIHASKL